jgi:ATP-dependent Lon protease
LTKLLLVPLEDIVVFPSMTVTLTVDVGDEERVLLVPKHEGAYARVGTVAEVADRVRLPGGGRAVALTGLYRGLAGAAEPDASGRLFVEVEESRDDESSDPSIRELEREYRAVVEEILELRGDDGRIAAFVRSIVEPGALADTSGYSPDLTFEQKVELLETVGVKERLELALRFQRERLTLMQLRKRIRDDVNEGVEQQQREYILRKQLESIRKELGEDDASVVDEYRAKIAEAGMPEEVRGQAERELGRFERMGESSPEASMIRNYLDWLLAVPWGTRSEERLDPVHTREVLDADHAGLEDVKDRIVEYIAVAKLRKERGIEPDRRAGAILTLIGPPGTGKTSIGESVAKALGREFVRMSLGGVRDEAEIRGHRRTYIGALPGRLVRALRDAGTMNPVILLDEVDKVGADWRGDPSAALLEVLDPAQNHSFRDHYLDVEVDLSEVFFIATANITETIPGPLLDRMEVIRFDGYTTDEKVAIANGYLWPRQRERAGLREDEVAVRDDAIETVVSEYTREAGVRQLERELGSILRKTATAIATGRSEPPVEIDIAAVRDALGRQKFFREAAERTAVPGVATGLAVNVTGGDVLFVEATSVRSTCTSRPGRFRRTARARASPWRLRSLPSSRAAR